MATNNLGYGGINYATANTSGRQGIVQNQNKISSDQNFKQDEINRTLSVIANRQAQGLDTSAQQKYLTVNLGYTPSNQPNPMVQAANNVSSTPQATYTPPTQNTLGQIQDFINKQSQFQYTTPDPFTYDQNTDPAYQAQLAEAKKNIANQQADTNAFLRGNGQGKSSYSEMVSNQVADSTMASIANDLVPQLMQQAYQRYTDDANRNLQIQQLNYGVGQDTISGLSNLYGLQDKEYFQNPITEAELTGNYLPAEARQVINQLLGLKQQAETKGITAQERAGLSQQADVLRSKLQALGVDPSLYGANVNSKTAAANNPGIRTLAGQQIDLQKQGQDFNQKFSQEQFAYQKARDAISDKQWQAQFDESVRQYGLNYGLNMLQENNQQAYRQAQLALGWDDSDRSWSQLDWQMSNPSSSSASGLTANQVLQSMKSLYTEPVYSTNDVGNQTKVGTQISQDAAKREQMFLNVVDSGLTDTETNQILQSLGMTKTEIDKYMQKYGASLGN